MIGSITQTDSVQHLALLSALSFHPMTYRLCQGRTLVPGATWQCVSLVAFPMIASFGSVIPVATEKVPHTVTSHFCSLAQSVPACFAEAGEPPAFISAVAQTRIPIQTPYFPRTRRPLVVGRHRFAVRQQTCFLKRVSIMIGLIAIHSFNK